MESDNSAGFVGSRAPPFMAQIGQFLMQYSRQNLLFLKFNINAPPLFLRHIFATGQSIEGYFFLLVAY